MTRSSRPPETCPTGHLQIKAGAQGRVRYALWRDADGRHRTRLGAGPRTRLRAHDHFTADAFGAPKSQRVRSVPMSDPVARVLDAFSRRDEGTGPDDLVFSPGFNVPFYDDTAVPVRKRASARRVT